MAGTQHHVIGEIAAGPRRRRLPRWAARCALVLLASIVAGAGVARAADDDSDDDAPKKKPAFPTTYLDLSTSYATLPAGVVSIGFGPPVIAGLLPHGLPASRSVGINAPLTVDVTDKISIYGGFHASTVQAGSSGWTPLAIDSWQIGSQYEFYSQNGGAIPTMTLQTTINHSATDTPFAITSFTNLLELDKALNKDETRGLLAGVQVINFVIDSNLAHSGPDVVGYLGGYYQWDNDWKLTGRGGFQYFGGLQLLSSIHAPAFTQPIVRLDLDLMDDNDNRLFGIWGQIAWTPAPSFMLTVRTPIFAVRN